jgi:DNA repair protein RecO (recombination protein O)
MKESDIGIFIHRTPFSDSSAIVSYFTKNHGFQKFVFLGARKKKSQMFPLNIQELHYFKRPDSEMGKLTSAQSNLEVANIPFDPIKSSLAFFIAEIIQKCVNHTEKDEALFSFLCKEINTLDQTDNLSLFPHRFLLNFAKYLGIQPQILDAKPTTFHLVEGEFRKENTAGLSLNGDEMLLLLNLLKEESVSSTLSTRKLALDGLIRYYQLHLEHFGELRTKSIVEELFRA